MVYTLSYERRSFSLFSHNLCTKPTVVGSELAWICRKRDFETKFLTQPTIADIELALILKALFNGPPLRLMSPASRSHVDVLTRTSVTMFRAELSRKFI